MEIVPVSCKTTCSVIKFEEIVDQNTERESPVGVPLLSYSLFHTVYNSESLLKCLLPVIYKIIT
jgi:hypothetical protein